METSNQTEDTPNPYGEPTPHEEGSPAEEASWGWQPTPPVTRAATGAEYSEPAPETPYLEAPESEPEQQQQYYSPKVQPLQPRQPTQPLIQSAPPPPPRPVDPSSTATATPTRRRAILSEEPAKAEQLGLPSRATTSYMVSGVRHANKRRSTSLFKLLGLLFLVNLLIIGAFGAWLYNHFVGQVEARMADFSSRPLPSGSGTSSSPRASITSAGGATAVEIKQLQDTFDKRFSDLKAQLQAAQSRISETESTQQQQQTRVNALASQVGSGGAAEAPARAPGEAVASAAVPGVEMEIPPSENELILLKERNRLTTYADEAIATGAREPYDRLWQALEDQRLVKLIHAARAEILRVQNFYLAGSRIESYTIQVGDYFPDSASLKDSQLKDEQLIELLEKKDNPWQVRMKAANLLGLRRSRAVGDALVKAVKYDENLDVVKEATFSFEQMTGFRARIFEPASMDAWWLQYNAAPGSATKTAAVAPPAPPAGSAKKNSPPPAAIPVSSPPSVKEMQPELRLPEWDEEQEARERGDKPVSDQQKAKEKKPAEKQPEAKGASAPKTGKKKTE